MTVTGYGLSGADAGNYSLAQPSGLFADITAADLTITANNASSKKSQLIQRTKVIFKFFTK